MNDVVEFLKEYIWKNGFNTLSENPFGVYKAMNGIDPRDARLVLITLMSKTHEMAQKSCSAEAIVTHIQAEHFVNKTVAKELAAMYLNLFDDANKKSWNAAKESGFKEFCKKKNG